jgi:hypothetical protein
MLQRYRLRVQKHEEVTETCGGQQEAVEEEGDADGYGGAVGTFVEAVDLPTWVPAC